MREEVLIEMSLGMQGVVLAGGLALNGGLMCRDGDTGGGHVVITLY